MSEVYSIVEVASAAETVPDVVLQWAEIEQVLVVDGCVSERDAVTLVRKLREMPGGRAPLTPLASNRRKQGLPLAASGMAHVGLLAFFIIASSLGLLTATEPEPTPPDTKPVKLVFLMSPGPGGGGGGGGLKVPAPPPRARLKAPQVKRTSSPVPPPRPTPPPPRPVIQEVKTPPPPPTPARLSVSAPVVPIAGDRFQLAGLPTAPPSPAPPSPGPGTGGGIGSGRGTGLGEGSGSGIGPGSGGGIGGGPYRPGTGIEPPRLLKEVRPLYTEDARRRALEGDVMLEIVVRRDGSVGDVRVVRALGSGLEQRAITAVRQWRFAPATRLGAAVDVVVEVAVGFTLR